MGHKSTWNSVPRSPRTELGARNGNSVRQMETVGRCDDCRLELPYSHFPPNWNRPYCPKCKSSNVIKVIRPQVEP